MEESIAKAFARRLRRDLTENYIERGNIKRSLRDMNTFSQLSLSAQNRVMDADLKLLKDFSIHSVTHGQKLKKYTAFTLMQPYDINELYDRPEDSIVPVHYIHGDETGTTDSTSVAMRINMHAVRRFFQRAPLHSSDSYEKWRSAFLNEVSIVDSASHLIEKLTRSVEPSQCVCQNCLSEKHPIKVFCPTPSGAFLGDYNQHFRVFEVRTYLPDEFLSQRQHAAKRVLLPIFKALNNTTVHLERAVAHESCPPNSLFLTHMHTSLAVRDLIAENLGHELIKHIFLRASPNAMKRLHRIVQSGTKGTWAFILREGAAEMLNQLTCSEAFANFHKQARIDCYDTVRSNSKPRHHKVTESKALPEFKQPPLLSAVRADVGGFESASVPDLPLSLLEQVRSRLANSTIASYQSWS